MAQNQWLAGYARERPDCPHWTFGEVRRGALALAREIERRAPGLATSKWWKEERRGVFLDYNQNANDRTKCSAYSARPVADARVSEPLHWHEVHDCEPADFTVMTMPRRFAEIGDPHASIDAEPGSLEGLLELAASDEAVGLGDEPWRRIFGRWKVKPGAFARQIKHQEIADQDAVGRNRQLYRT